MKKRWKLAGILLLAMGLLYLHHQHPISMEEVLSWQPENLLLAALAIECFFAIKSASVFIPIMIPQILAGHLYPRDIALTINLLGLVIVMSVPYWIGKGLGSAKMEQLLQKYPKIRSILKVQDDNQMAVSFMLRACAVPPADVVTMYLGATGMPFLTNVIGGTLGSFPGMVLHTFLGANIRDPNSPAFWQALSLNILWIALSGLGFYLFKKFHSGKEENP